MSISNSNKKPLMIVHGGAWSIPLELEADHINGTKEAIAQVFPKVLSGEINAEEAVIQAICILENDETFDAGKGSFLNLKGQVEMDASIMNGTTLNAGAVCGIQNVRNPIKAAAYIMNHTDHVMLVGGNAEEFIKDNCCKTEKERREWFVDSVEELLTERELKFLEKIRNNSEFSSRSAFEVTINNQPSTSTASNNDDNIVVNEDNNVVKENNDEDEPKKRGTVGCVVLDRFGNICAGTSTGGTPKKIPGRSGDTGIIGSGTYADSTVAGTSSTGFGESIMKIQMASTCVRWLEFNNIPPKEEDNTCLLYSHHFLNNEFNNELNNELKDDNNNELNNELNNEWKDDSNNEKKKKNERNVTKEQEAVERVIEYLNNKVNGLGGLILLSKNGKYAAVHNTDKMAFSYADENSVNVENQTFKVVSIVSKLNN
ncbi:hypothetical protein ABK040_002172 [Willaertia magna]